MAHFARKLRYAANDGENGATFAALIELANKKGGPPTGFVLFWRIFQHNSSRSESKMIRLKAKTADEAIEKFWLSGSKFPGWQSRRWQKTTPWLDRVGAGGGYEQFPPLTWVKVGTPNLWAKRRKKRIPKFGDMGFVLRECRVRLRELEIQRRDLIDDLPEGFDYRVEECYGHCFSRIPHSGDTEKDAQTRMLLGQLEDDILTAQDDIGAIEAEMRFKVYRMFPAPIGKMPRRVLRKQLEQAHASGIW